MPREAVPAETARALGFLRTSAAMADAIAAEADLLVEEGALRISGFQVTLP